MSLESVFLEEKNTLKEYVLDLETFTLREDKLLGGLDEGYIESLKEIAATPGKRDDKMDEMRIANKSMERMNYSSRRSYLAKIKRILHSPYFSRVDVKTSEEARAKTYYIGKLGFPGDKIGKVITDWRSPVASLYYNYPFSTPDAFFKRTAFNALDSEETIKCSLDVRRTIEIEHKNIINIYDNSLLDRIDTDDQFLLSKLKSKSGGKLEDIIETIQADQNEIIRHSPFSNVIVQGVAGSGKTTIAIHRISYLFYNFPEKILPLETLFVSTSKVLINYLSKSLPELDIYGIKRASLLEILKESLDENNIRLKKKVVSYVQNSELFVYFSNLSDFEERLESYIASCENTIRTSLGKLDNSLLNNNFINTSKTIERFKDKPIISTLYFIRDDLKETSLEITKEIRFEKDNYTVDYGRKNLSALKETIKVFDAFLKTINFEDLYQRFLAENYGSTTDTYDVNHLSSLYYLTYKLGGLTKPKDYRLIVLDEAQDLNRIHFKCIKSLSSRNCFNFMGDLNQSVSKRLAINSWNDINDIFESNKTAKYELTISYRSTKQIIEAANTVLRSAGVKTNLPIPVSKEGLEPVTKVFSKIDDLTNDIANTIKNIRNSDLKSIGIIETSDLADKNILETLKDKGINVERVTEYFDNFKPDGIFLIPLRNVKGLEFDTVFILNEDSEDFLDSIEGHFKRFVCYTRAMSRLYIYKLSL